MEKLNVTLSLTRDQLSRLSLAIQMDLLDAERMYSIGQDPYWQTKIEDLKQIDKNLLEGRVNAIINSK